MSPKCPIAVYVNFLKKESKSPRDAAMAMKY